MDESISIINNLIVDVFNDILSIEAASLKKEMFKDVSITEVHTIEAIGLHTKKTASEVARKLRITAGTLTTAINALVKKDYVERSYTESDRRIVMLSLTKKGRLLFRVHEKFHSEMIKQAISELNNKERDILASSLAKIHKFFGEEVDFA